MTISTSTRSSGFALMMTHEGSSPFREVTRLLLDIARAPRQVVMTAITCHGAARRCYEHGREMG